MVKTRANTSETVSNTGGTPSKKSASTTPSRQVTKQILAITFVVGVLVVIGLLPFIGLMSKRIDLDNYKDIVLTLGGILAGPLGIIINNYFREGDES